MRPKVKKPSMLPDGAPVEALAAGDDLADPELGDDDEPAPDTARPDFEPLTFAREVETAEERMTLPPAPAYEMLRDSCKTGIVPNTALDEEAIVKPSSARMKMRT